MMDWKLQRSSIWSDAMHRRSCWRQFFCSLGLFLFFLGAAKADALSETCRRKCGQDEACYRTCIETGGAGPDDVDVVVEPKNGGSKHYHHYHHDHPEAPSHTRDGSGDGSTGGGGGGAGAFGGVGGAGGKGGYANGGSDRRASQVRDTAFDFLYAIGSEQDRYGLYSYVILPAPSPRALALLSEIFKSTPSVGSLSTPREEINILYFPTKSGSKGKFRLDTGAARVALQDYLDHHYDYGLARSMLGRIVCGAPKGPDLVELCGEDFGAGPLILTYHTKISGLAALPPPYLVLDLRNVRPEGFGEFLAAYYSQVKREDYSDRRQLDTFRLKLLNVAQTFMQWINPVEEAAAKIVHMESGEQGGTGKEDKGGK
jgi:hypothetical protein